MTKTSCNPRVGARLHPDFEAHPDVAFGSALTVEPASSLLASLGVRRIEADVPLDMAAAHLCGKGFDVSVHYPWRYVTSGRICSFAGVGKDHEKRFILDAKCSRLCREYYLQMRRGICGEMILQGNAILWNEDQDLSPEPLPGEKPVPGLRLIFNPVALRWSGKQ
jgi:hypothetical protein